MKRAELDCLARMFEAVTSVGEPQVAHLQILEAVCELTHGFGGHYAYLKSTVEQGKLMDLTAGDSAAMAKINRDHPHFIFENPLWPHLSSYKGSVLRHIDVVGEREWINCEFHSGFCSPNHLRDGLVVLFRDSSGEAHAGLGLMYDKRMTFSRQTIAALERLAPYLSRGIMNLDAWHKRLRNTTAEGEDTPGAQPMIAVRNGKLLYAVNGAVEILGLTEFGLARNSYLHECLRLCRSAGDLSARVNWTARDGRIFRLIGINSARKDIQLVRLVLNTPSIPAPEEDYRLALAAGLTTREAAVFQRMARGLSYKEIARDMSISYHTVRAHIRHIYARLKVSGAVEALNAIRSHA
ncbi:MAG TPA: helix-turn-helix transcriptional regulator [Planctomycetota bacterium]|nr:helix-turn-helix transcriptional regulator [Planctomycetota bacterium]